MTNVEHPEHPSEEVPAFLIRYAAEVDRWHDEAEQAEDSAQPSPDGSREATRRPATAWGARLRRPDG